MKSTFDGYVQMLISGEACMSCTVMATESRHVSHKAGVPASREVLRPFETKDSHLWESVQARQKLVRIQ
jgi:hypothetical protein